MVAAVLLERQKPWETPKNATIASLRFERRQQPPSQFSTLWELREKQIRAKVPLCRANIMRGAGRVKPTGPRSKFQMLSCLYTRMYRHVGASRLNAFCSICARFLGRALQ
jgi:hypothetical protein